MVAEEDRLSPLRMAYPGMMTSLYFSAAFTRDSWSLLVGNGCDFPANIEVRIEGHLIVAAPPRMTFSRFANGIGKSLFNIHMNIFEFDRKVKIPVFDLLENNLQAFYDGVLIRTK